MDGEPWGHPVIMVPCSLPHTPVGLGGPVHSPVMASRATGFGGGSMGLDSGRTACVRACRPHGHPPGQWGTGNWQPLLPAPTVKGPDLIQPPWTPASCSGSLRATGCYLAPSVPRRPRRETVLAWGWGRGHLCVHTPGATSSHEGSPRALKCPLGGSKGAAPPQHPLEGDPQAVLSESEDRPYLGHSLIYLQRKQAR